MEDFGWVKLHRKILSSQIWMNHNGLKVWLWILLKANWSDEPNWVGINTGKGNTSVRVFQGQFIYGRKTAAIELNMNESTVDYWVRKLESSEFGMICRQPKTHFTIIQVNNWMQYQGGLVNNQITTNYQPNNTNKNIKKYKKGKNTLDLGTIDPSAQLPDFSKTDTIQLADANCSISVAGEAPVANTNGCILVDNKLNPKITYEFDITELNDEPILDVEEFIDENTMVTKQDTITEYKIKKNHKSILYDIIK